jgi:hypothetical protein
MFLTDEQLRRLAGCKRSDAQRRELEHMGVPFRVRRDGTLVVCTADVPKSATIAPELRTPEPELEP